MAITPLPTPPSRDDPTNFSARGDAFLGALPTFATEANALAVDVNADAAAAAVSASDAETAATGAEAAAVAASAAANVTKWISGTTYTEGTVVWSPISYLSYRRKTTGGGTTDPSADSTNWAQAAGTGDVTLSATQTLTNKTISAANNTLTGVALLAANTFTGNQTGGDNSLVQWDFKDTGWVYFNSGTTNALDYTNGSHQRWAPNTGAQTLSITNWPPSGNLGELLIEGVNLGAATITWPTINWIKSDGTTTTTFSSNGVTLQTSGTDWVFLWTRDAGTTIYGKVVR